MRRLPCTPREDWRKLAESRGFDFHTNADGTEYWKEDAYYEISTTECDQISAAIKELHSMCLKAVERIVSNSSIMDRLQLPPGMQDIIRKSWWSQNRQRYVYGRFDLIFDPDTADVKLLEYNADTPTSLPEAGRFQKDWATQQNCTQFNTLESDIITRWKDIRWIYNMWNETVYFSAIKDHKEDEGNAKYMMSLAQEGGTICKYIPIEDITYNYDRQCFVDTEGNHIKYLWKLYPWEWMMQEEFFQHIDKLEIIEPPWKLLLSNKGILAILHEMYPNHRNLLPAYWTPEEAKKNKVSSYILKPIYGREGANMIMIRNGAHVYESLDQGYAGDGYVCQKLLTPSSFEGYHHVIGGWVIGENPAGMSIREDSTLITTNVSKFVPHVVA